jgi:alpha-L-fucosidase 2
MGWKVNFWARLLDGDHALALIRAQLTLVDPVTEPSGGTFPNFLDSHPPFQIDGNFGCTAGIAEMLMQTHAGAVHLLPALPAAWAEHGGATGLRAYGGFDVDFIWSNGQVEQLVVRSTLGGNFRVRVPNQLILNGGGHLAEATGDNPNAFFATPPVHEPIISPEADLDDPHLEPTFLYDLST